MKGLVKGAPYGSYLVAYARVRSGDCLDDDFGGASTRVLVAIAIGVEDAEAASNSSVRLYPRSPAQVDAEIDRVLRGPVPPSAPDQS